MPIPRKGFSRSRNASQFTENGQVFLATTDTYDVGTNDAGVLCLNDEVVSTGGSTAICHDPLGSTVAASSGRLAFEMVALVADAPTGGCCNKETGTCTEETLAWVRAAGTCSDCPNNPCSRSEECGTGNSCITGGYRGDGQV